MNKQEILDYTYQKLWEQNKQSIAEGTCLYRHPDGLKCAAGFLIPDDKYNPTMEDNSFTSGFCLYYDLPEWMTEEADFILDIQVVHDYYRGLKGLFRDHLNKGFYKVAAKHNLNFTPNV